MKHICVHLLAKIQVQLDLVLVACDSSYFGGRGKRIFWRPGLAASLSSIVRIQLKPMKHEISSSLTQIYFQEWMECKWWKFIDRICKILIFFLNLVFAWTHTNLAKDLNVFAIDSLPRLSCLMYSSNLLPCVILLFFKYSKQIC